MQRAIPSDDPGSRSDIFDNYQTRAFYYAIDSTRLHPDLEKTRSYLSGMTEAELQYTLDGCYLLMETIMEVQDEHE